MGIDREPVTPRETDEGDPQFFCCGNSPVRGCCTGDDDGYPGMGVLDHHIPWLPARASDHACRTGYAVLDRVSDHLVDRVMPPDIAAPDQDPPLMGKDRAVHTSRLAPEVGLDLAGDGKDIRNGDGIIR
jgi:hypothetical protein